MNEQNLRPQEKKPKTLDQEIAAAQEKLNRLIAQKRDKERKDLERNQKAVYTLLRNERLDAAPVETWTAALPALRKLLKVEPSKPAHPAPMAARRGPPLPAPQSLLATQAPVPPSPAPLASQISPTPA